LGALACGDRATRPTISAVGVRSASRFAPACRAAVVLAVASACTSRAELAERTVRLVGSDTEVNAAQMLAEAYRERHPRVVVSVAGGGSGAGIAALLDGRTDIANSSRQVRQEEVELARGRGLELANIVLGIDALAVIVNERSGIDSIGLKDLRRLFRGEVRRWAALGGRDQAVTLYGRQSNSGTYLFFRERVVRDDYARDMRNLNGNAQVVEAVRADPGGIGYVGVGYVLDDDGQASRGIRILDIRTGEGSVHPADRTAVERGAYPISRPLFQYFAVPIRGSVADYLRFELSNAGQAIVESEGFYRAGRASRRSHRELLERVRSEARPGPGAKPPPEDSAAKRREGAS